MALNAFIKIADIPGESENDKHKEWIEVTSFSHSISQTAMGSTGSAGARTSGRCDHGDWSFTKELDKASPKLALACCNGTHIPTIDIEMSNATGDESVVLTIKLKDVLITSVSLGGSSGSYPSENVTLNYANIEVIYNETDHRTGKPKGKITYKWDVGANKGA